MRNFYRNMRKNQTEIDGDDEKEEEDTIRFWNPEIANADQPFV